MALLPTTTTVFQNLQIYVDNTDKLLSFSMVVIQSQCAAVSKSKHLYSRQNNKKMLQRLRMMFDSNTIQYDVFSFPPERI